MANVCAYQFVLRPQDGQSSRACLDAVRDEIADWIGEIYRAVGLQGVALPFDGTCLAPHPTHELCSEQRDSSTHRLTTIEWVWPEGTDPTLSWVLAATVACDDRAVQVALLVQIVSRPFLLRPLCYALSEKNPLAYLPGLATRLLRLWPGEVGGWPIRPTVRVLRANAMDQFVRETLQDPARSLPLVLVNLDGPVKIQGNGLQAAQDRLLGLAQVAALANAPAVKRLRELLPQDAPWDHCPARVYWPSLPDEPPGRYPLFTGADIRQELQKRGLDQVLLDRFLEYTAARFREGDLIRAARLAVDREQAAWHQVAKSAENEVGSARAAARQAEEDRDRLRQECEAARQLIRSLQTDLASLRDAALAAPERAGTFDELAAEVERSWDDNRRLTAELEAQRRRVAELSEEVRNHQENWALFAASRTEEPAPIAAVRRGERTFADVAEALQAAATEFADVLAVWDSARRAAALSPFKMPGKVYRALEAIAEVGRAYFTAKDGGPPLGPVERAFACRVPFKYSGFESQTTLHLYGVERVFHHGAESRQMQRHLTLGGGDTNNCLQIYFDFDDAGQRVLVGYCGRHLPYHRQRT